MVSGGAGGQIPFLNNLEYALGIFRHSLDHFINTKRILASWLDRRRAGNCWMEACALPLEQGWINGPQQTSTDLNGSVGSLGSVGRPGAVPSGASHLSLRVPLGRVLQRPQLQ